MKVILPSQWFQKRAKDFHNNFCFEWWDRNSGNAKVMLSNYVRKTNEETTTAAPNRVSKKPPLKNIILKQKLEKTHVWLKNQSKYNLKLYFIPTNLYFTQKINKSYTVSVYQCTVCSQQSSLDARKRGKNILLRCSSKSNAINTNHICKEDH